MVYFLDLKSLHTNLRLVATTVANFVVFFGCHIFLVTVGPYDFKFIVPDRFFRSHDHYIVVFTVTKF